MNTHFEYSYCDASGYKRFGEAVFAGEPDTTLCERLQRTLSDAEFFIPRQVGLPELYLIGFPLNGDDHCWHVAGAIRSTDDEPSDARSFGEFVEVMERAAIDGWQVFDPLVALVWASSLSNVLLVALMNTTKADSFNLPSSAQGQRCQGASGGEVPR